MDQGRRRSTNLEGDSTMSTSTSDLSPREHFAALLKELESCTVRGFSGLQQEMEEEILAKHRELHPRSKRKVPERGDPKRWGFLHLKLRSGMEAEFDEIVERYHSISKRRLDEAASAKKEIQTALAELAIPSSPLL